MSHAANIRNRHRPDHPQLPSSKRRKTSPSHNAIHKPNGIVPLANGSYSASDFVATPTKDIKTSGVAQPVESDAKIRLPDDGRDVEMEASEDGESVSGVDDFEADDSEEGSAEADDEEDEDEDEDGKPVTNGVHHTETSEIGAEHEGHEEEQPSSFGDMLKSRGHDTIDVQGLHSGMNAPTLDLAPPFTNQSLSVPTAASLGTVLTQALKTNDVDLLESCFQVPNLDSIRATIERLHSSHATKLLQKLAERLHKRPGRAGSLMVWVQWTIVAHGGYLAGQPGAMRELHTLHQVVRQRATGLQPLLALKGKLDMLEAQMQLRRNVQSRTRAGISNDIGITYIEGQESDGEDDVAVVAPSIKQAVPKTLESDQSDEEDEMPTSLPNGVDIDALSDDEDDSDDREDANLVDDEAEETDEDSEMLSDDVDYDDVDAALVHEESDEEEEEDEAKEERPSKKLKQARNT